MKRRLPAGPLAAMLLLPGVGVADSLEPLANWGQSS